MHPLPFTCEKHPATGSRGMAVTNHPAASAVAATVLAEGGNAIDAAVAALFALSVVEPMMVGPLGGGLAHIRLADGRHTVIDGMSTAPARAWDGMFDAAAVAGRANLVGRWRWRSRRRWPAGAMRWRSTDHDLTGCRGRGDPPGRARLHGDAVSDR